MAGNKPAIAAVPDADAAPAEKESTVKQRLLGQAMITLRERHRDEYDEIARSAFRAVGLEYKRRLSEKERAEAKIMDLARANGIDVRIVAGESEDAPAEA